MFEIFLIKSLFRQSSRTHSYWIMFQLHKQFRTRMFCFQMKLHISPFIIVGVIISKVVALRCNKQAIVCVWRCMIRGIVTDITACSVGVKKPVTIFLFIFWMNVLTTNISAIWLFWNSRYVLTTVCNRGKIQGAALYSERFS